MSHKFYRFVFWLIGQMPVSGQQAHTTSTEDIISAKWGPIEATINACFVLDSRDANLTFVLSESRCLWLSVTACIGTEQVRRTGVHLLLFGRHFLSLGRDNRWQDDDAEIMF